MKNCFGYVRVSSQKQGEGISLEAQKDAILRFAAQNGVAISEWFEEQQTAAKSGRPVFNDMLKALRAGRAEGVVMHKIDRSARNFFDWAKIGELADSGIDVHFATESLDFRSRGGRLTANIQMAVAEDYVRNLRSEILKGQRGQLERGFYPFSAPFGYRDNGKRQLKTVDPVVGPFVRLAFELYGSGQYSLNSLRQEMAEHGLVQASGKPLNKGCFERILNNSFYAGVIHIRRTGEVYKGAHEPLISPALFKRVQQVKSGKSGKKRTRHNHVFRGLFACGSCGRSMIPEKQKNHVYYRCQNPDCLGNCVREEQLDEAVLSELRSHAVPDAVREMVDACIAAAAQPRDTPDNSVALQLAAIDDRLEKLEDAAIAQIIDKDGFVTRKQRLMLEKATLEDRQREAIEFHRQPAVIHTFLELLKNLAPLYEIVDPAEKREIVEIALSNRSVQAKKVSVEPSKWLLDTQKALDALSCADDRDTSRTCHPQRTHEQIFVQQLVDAASSSEFENLFAVLKTSANKSMSSRGLQLDRFF